MLRVTLASLLIPFATACTVNTGSTPTSGGDPPAAGPNTSLASAMSLAKGQPVTVVFPCSGRIYFGPFAFTQDPETVKILYSNKSNSGAQVCTGGAWVNKDDVQVDGNAGTGCVEGASPTTGYIDHTHSPGNGGDGTTPAYFYLQIGDGGGAPGCESATITLTLQ